MVDKLPVETNRHNTKLFMQKKKSNKINRAFIKFRVNKYIINEI